MNARFDKWFDWLIPWEGTVYENDPDDPGGETKYGIDKRSHPKEDIRNLTRERAKEIYLAEYWNKVKADDLPFGVGEVVADIAVNCGYSRAAKWLQQATFISSDGIIGPLTLEAAQQANRNELVETLLDRRELHYRSIAHGKLAKFLKGWLNRNDSLRNYVRV